MKALLVEDEKGLREIFSEALESLGFDVDAASSVEEAGNLLNDLSEPPRVVVLDIYLPDGTGLAVASMVKEKFPTVPVIMMTGQPSGDTVDSAIHKDVDGYIIKPVSMGDFLKSVREISGIDY